MPAGSRIRSNNVYGTITNTPLTSGATVFNSAELVLLPEISGQHAVIVLDPKRTFGPTPEIVVVTAHTAAATTATITRGQYGTVAREHPEFTEWAHIPIDEDYIEVLTSGTRPSNPYEGQMIYETNTDKYMFYNGTTWLQPGSASPRMGWHVTRVANQLLAPNPTITAISWDTEVQDTHNNFTPNATTGTTLTIPSGGDGLWMITFQANMAISWPYGVSMVQIVAGSFTFKNVEHDDAGQKVAQSINISVVVPLVAANTIVCSFLHGASSSQNVVGRLVAYRIGN